jgi:putative ABC transport system permease protein
MIRLKNVSKEYNGVIIINNISINFRRNEFVAILGASGSGKTTLLNMMGGNLLPSKGDIYLGNNNLKDLNLDYYHNYYVSYIYQNYNLISNLNVYDNIILGLKLSNKKMNKNKINLILNKLSITSLVNKNINNISGGEKQRVAIARTLVSDSNIILADEPTGALDSLNSFKIMNILKKISLSKLVIMVTHNEELANKYATRIIKIKDGKIISDSNPYKKYLNINLNKYKPKLKLKDLFKISLNNFKSKRGRNTLTIIAFFIGLFSLSLVLSISNGFKKELNNLEHNSLYNYPLIISKESLNINNSLKENIIKKGDLNINKREEIIKVKIDNKLLDKINNLDQNLISGVSFYRDIDYNFKKVSYINPSNNYFKLLDGRFPTNQSELLLLVDDNNAINENVREYLNLSSFSYNDLYNLNVNNLKIVGVVKARGNNYFSSLNGLLYSNNLFDNEITDIYIYPKDYKSKEIIKKKLKGYYINDNAKVITNLTNNLIKGISLVLIIFSAISLIVSIIMISVISYINVLERSKEIGVMKSLGSSKNDIKKIFILENNIIGFMASYLALDLTYLLSNIINKVISNKINIKHLINMDFKVILTIIILSIILTYAASLIPSKIASNKEITSILHNN